MQVFDFKEIKIRVACSEDGEIWFNANDVCLALECLNPRKAISAYVDRGDLTKRVIIDFLGHTQYASHINERGVHALISGSTKPEAKRFERFLINEIIPSLHNKGLSWRFQK
jgi:prophage antirepressor-like protein